MTSQQQKWSLIPQCEFQQLGSSNGVAGALAKFLSILGVKSKVAIPLAVHLHVHAMYGHTVYNYNTRGLAKLKGNICHQTQDFI